MMIRKFKNKNFKKNDVCNENGGDLRDKLDRSHASQL